MREHSDHHGHAAAQRGARPALLCISQSFAPATTPTAIRASKLLARLGAQWDITVVTETGRPDDTDVTVEVVRGRRPRRLLALLRRLRLSKLAELAIWPDDSIFWVLPAIRAARRVLRVQSCEAIVVFMMPYSAGLAGIALKRLTSLPLVLNLDDSPTCTDMHPHFPTRLHHRLAHALEDLFVRRADAVVYVSRTNLERVRARQRARDRQKLRLVRYGADPADFHPQRQPAGVFQIAYVGAMSGWWALIEQHTAAGRAKRAYGAWTRLGRYERLELDPRTSSPAPIGAAVHAAVAAQPQLAGHVSLTVYGDPYPADVIARALACAGVEDVVKVLGPVPHDRVADLMARADLLFLTLPRRTDGSRGGRISAKTYEYLMTDRPILAAVPQGENWDYLEGRPGVWLVDPDDELRMSEVIAELANAKLGARAQAIDRSGLRAELSYETRAEELAEVIRTAIARRADAAADRGGKGAAESGANAAADARGDDGGDG